MNPAFAEIVSGSNGLKLRVYIYICVCVCVFVFVWVFVRVCGCGCVCIYVSICIYVCYILLVLRVGFDSLGDLGKLVERVQEGYIIVGLDR
jgi:hypothetical protein